MIVSFDFLFELSVGIFELIDAHCMLFNLKLYFLQLVHRQVFFLFNILMHTALVKHINSVLFVEFFQLASSSRVRWREWKSATLIDLTKLLW